MVRPRLIGTVADAIRRALARLRGSHAPGTEGHVPAPGSAIAIEWGGDLETLTFRWTDWDGSQYEAKVKARCARCWGGLVARHDDRHQITGIKCRVCGEKLEGEAAREEHARMFNEHAANLGNVTSGRLPHYADDATFVLKTFPAREGMSPDDFYDRIARAQATPSTRNRIDRNDFPPGSPATSFFRPPRSWRVSKTSPIRTIGLSWTFRTSVFATTERPVWTVSIDDIADDPQFHERRLLRNLGDTLTAAMISAFACELAMKAVCLAVNDQAFRKHDLKQLYDDLPEPSRLRVAADFPGIAAALDAGRQTFDSWRYFETAVAEVVAQALIDTGQARNLGKAARVILDEAEMVGLGCAVNLKGRLDVGASDDAGNYRQRMKIDVNIKAVRPLRVTIQCPPHTIPHIRFRFPDPVPAIAAVTGSGI